MSKTLEKYGQWPNNKQSLVGVERVIFRIADSVAGHCNLRNKWATMHSEAKAALLDEWKQIATDEFIGTLKEAMKEHGHTL